jgi:hypothetical protein
MATDPVGQPSSTPLHYTGIPRAAARLPRKYRSSTGSAAPADRAAQRPPYDVDHLVDVLVGLAPFSGRPDATLDVILENEDRDGVDRRPQGGRLLEDVYAVLLALDHPGNAPDLALHSRQAPDESSTVLRIGVAEVVGLGAGHRRAVGLGHGRPPSL